MQQPVAKDRRDTHAVDDRRASAQGDATLVGRIPDSLPWGSPGAREIGFALPRHYNASELLFRNLTNGRAAHPAVIGPAGKHSYPQLCAYAARWGNALLWPGLQRRDRHRLRL